MSFHEVRCHICGAMLDGKSMGYAMGKSNNPFEETCSQKCYDSYYSDPDNTTPQPEKA